MQPGFMIYADDWLNYAEEYSAEEIGEMLKALLAYFTTGENAAFTDRGMRQFYRQTKKSIDFDRIRYDNKCLQNAYNRYRGTCKKKGIEPLVYEDWLSTVNDGQQPSTKPTNNQSPTINNQKPKTNNQSPEGMQGEIDDFINHHLSPDRTTEDMLLKMGGYGE